MLTYTRLRSVRLIQSLLLGVLAVCALVSTAPASSAASTVVEAESIPAPPSCWGTLSWGALSGGSARSCYVPSVALSWTVVVPPGQTATVDLHGYRDGYQRGYRVRVNHREWVTGTLTGPVAPSALFHTIPQLDAGSHTVELEWVSSSGGFTLDYYRVNTSSTSTAGTSPTSAAGSVCHIDPPNGQDAISAAIRACADGTTVLFPAGRTYSQTDKISVVGRKNLTIDGNGSTFVTSAPNDNWASLYQSRPNWQLVEGTNVTLRNMTIRGNLFPGGGRGILPGNQYNAGVAIFGGNGIDVTDVSVYDVFGEFVVANPSGFYHGGGALDGQVPTNVRIIRLQGRNAARQCVGVSAAQGFWLEDSTLSNCYQNGVDIEPDVAGERIRDVHILRNTISGFYFSAITVPTAYQAGDVDGIEIRGNKTTSTSDTCYPAVLIGGVQDNANPLYNVVVADNTLRTYYDGVKYTHVASGSVTGNNVTITVSRNWCGPPIGEPVRLINSANVAVYSNVTSGY